MGIHVIRKGLDLPIGGAPDQTLDTSKKCRRVAVVAADYVGMKPTFLVQEGDTVKRGQPLFEDKKQPGVLYTSPGAGTVSAINRGAKRALLSVVIDLNEREQAGEASRRIFIRFRRIRAKARENCPARKCAISWPSPGCGPRSGPARTARRPPSAGRRVRFS